MGAQRAVVAAASATASVDANQQTSIAAAPAAVADPQQRLVGEIAAAAGSQAAIGGKPSVSDMLAAGGCAGQQAGPAPALIIAPNPFTQPHRKCTPTLAGAAKRGKSTEHDVPPGSTPVGVKNSHHVPDRLKQKYPVVDAYALNRHDTMHDSFFMTLLPLFETPGGSTDYGAMAATWNSLYHTMLLNNTAGTLLATHERHLKHYHSAYRQLQAVQHTTLGASPHPQAQRRHVHQEQQQQQQGATVAAQVAAEAAKAAAAVAVATAAAASSASQPARPPQRHHNQGGKDVKKMCQGCRCAAGRYA